MSIRIGNAPCSWGVEFAEDPRNPPWRRVLQECRGLAATIGRRETTERMVNRLNGFYPAWQNFSANVNAVDNRFLERDVRRIDERVAVARQMFGGLR